METASTDITITMADSPPAVTPDPVSGGGADPSGIMDPSAIGKFFDSLPQTGDGTLAVIAIIAVAAAIALAIALIARRRILKGSGRHGGAV